MHDAEHDGSAEHAGFCTGEHLKTDPSTKACCCRKKFKHPAAWLGVFPYGLPWLRADLHRCVVNLYIYMFLPHFDGLLKIVIYRDYNGKRVLSADPSIEWLGPGHFWHFWLACFLLVNLLWICVYVLHGVQNETLGHLATHKGIFMLYFH